MTREIALHCMKSASELERELCEECPIYGQTGCDHCYEDALQYVIATLEQEPIDYKTQYENYLKKSEVVISQLRAERDRLQDAFDKLRAEIERQESNDEDMFVDASTIFGNAYDNYKNGELPKTIHIYE